ncbi:MAG: hypothetical protein JXN61_11965 [Sedimentisphaerales bacterium]|nr:hypothetical protein [Sedimentisphaerales bacterium]
MELRNNLKYVATSVKVFTTILIILTALLILQTIIVETARMLPRKPHQPATEAAKEQTEEEKRLSRIQYSAKNFLPDGTIHLVYQPGRTNYSQWEKSAAQQIYDVNDNLLWEGAAQNSPYKYLSWSTGTYGDWFRAADMRWINVVSPDVCRTLDIPVKSNNETTEIWRYISGKQSFIGYKTGGGIIGYAGATGFANSRSQAGPFGEFGSFVAWCPKDSATPRLLWQTGRSIYEIDFENREVELVFESPEADIETLFVHNWGSFKPRDVEVAEGYRPLIHCRTEDGRDHLIMRNPNENLIVKTPEDWNRWKGQYGRFAATERCVYLYRHWMDIDSLPTMPKNLTSPQAHEDWMRDYESRPKKYRVDLYKVDTQGNIILLNRYGWTLPGQTVPRPRWIYAWQKTRRCVSQFSPPLYDLLWYIPGIRMWRSDYDRGRNEILWEILILIEQSRPGPSAWNLVISALMVGFASWHGWPRRTSLAAFIFWLILVGLFNLAGLLTYLALNHTPIIKCPVCGKRRGLSQPQCVRCRADLPAPKPGKLDLIFDTQLKPTT